MRKAKILFIYMLFMVTSIACDQHRVFDQYKSVSDTWEKDEKLNFELPELSGEKAYNLFINLRNTNEYTYSNIFLITEMKFPQGKVVTDTLEYEMAAPNGEWLGTGFSDLKENKLWYKENIHFTEKGIYTVTIQHAMRKNGKTSGINSLEGITEVGFRIEDSQKP